MKKIAFVCLCMVSLSQVREDFYKKLARIYDPGEIHTLFLIAVEEVLGLGRTEYILRQHMGIAPELHSQLKEILEKLIQEVPIQQILGKASFYGLTFGVTPDTLIPRPETEELVDIMIRRHSKQGLLKILDIGTGSGCIAISLAKHLSNAEIFAVDVSPEALKAASKNAQKIGVDIRFRQVDITKWRDFFAETDRFDVIVSNPPYIRESEKRQMSKNVLNFEPYGALFVEDRDPLLFYDHISDFAKQNLTDNGTLYFEINQYLGAETVALIEKKGFQKVELFKDINGADRMVVAERNFPAS